MKKWFWTLAHKRYHYRRPSRLAEAAMIIWGIFFFLVYAAAFMSGWKPSAIEALIAVGLTLMPLLVGVMHLAVRVEASKGSDALYRKLLETQQKR